MSVTNNGYESSAIALRRSTTTITFDGTAGAGGIGTVTVFSITPDANAQFYVARIIPYCITDLAGATATVALLVGFAPAAIAATLATDIDAGEFWFSTAPAKSGAIPAALMNIVFANANITLDVAVAAITAGVLRIDVDYIPLTDGFNLGTYTIL